jgi:tRNA G18 (ribose-2'-O)-methylase SpoU
MITQLEHHHQTRIPVKYSLAILAQDVNDPANVGSLFRLADALGVAHLYLTGLSALPPNKKIRRSSRMTDQCVSWSYHPQALSVVAEFKNSGGWVISLEITNQSCDLRNIKIPPNVPILLVVGSENLGVDENLLNASNLIAHIPMLGQNSSMNLATACAIGVYEITRHISQA